VRCSRWGSTTFIGHARTRNVGIVSDASIEDRTGSFDGMATSDRAAPGPPAMLSHMAFITRDTVATADFYTRIMGMELVNAVLDDAIPSTGEPIPYFHSFFRLADGSTVAFFEAPELPPLAPLPTPPTTRSNTSRCRWRPPRGRPGTSGSARTASRCSARRPQDHLQHLLPRPQRAPARDHRPTLPTANAQRRAPSLADVPRQGGDGAAASGDDMVTVLAELTRERSHRRSS
jgi:catechol 2,3-dioxygenase-like lactoylglutathione lyase family enzyme